MTQELVDWWNGWDEGIRWRETLGMHMLEADTEHVLFEIRATEFNQIWGYFGGFALAGVLENAPGMLPHYEGLIEHVGTVSLEWLMTELNISFLSNTTGDSVLCDSRWLERGDSQCKVITEIRDGDNVLLRATSTHTKR